VKIRVADIEETEKEIAFVDDVAEVNKTLASFAAVDYQLSGGLPVKLAYYRAGADLFFRGQLSASVTGSCARCLESYPFSLRHELRFVLKPASEAEGDRDLSPDERVESFYEGDEVDLSPLLREAVLLALPTRPLCREDCAGLCPKCGANLNLGRCGCREEWSDPRLAVLRNLKRDAD
jgi:uncharacterized protein